MDRENKHLTNKEIEEITKILLAQKQSILNNLREHNKFRIDVNELSNPIDAASTNMETSENLRFMNRENFYLKKVLNALEKIKCGTHGICDECMADIPFKRLFARPTAELCIECKEDIEQEENQTKKVTKSYGKTLSEM